MIAANSMEEFARRHQRTKQRAAYDASTGPTGGGRGIAASPETLREYLERCGVEVRTTRQGRDGATVLILDGCPMNPDHGAGSDTAVILRSNGVIGFTCKHNSCAGHKWPDLRAKIDPDHHEQGQHHATDQSRPPQAAVLAKLAEDAVLFHSGDEPFATVPVGAHQETRAVHSKAVRLWLVRRFYEKRGRPPGAQSLQDALGVLAAKALFDGPELPVAVRLAEHDGVIWLDLGDETWEAVRVDATGWEIVGNPTVKFLRPQGQLALPRPVGGGSVDDLRPFVNIGRDEDWALLLTWLVAALHPTGPYPVLVLNGEQGAAKSTMCRVLRRLVDPNRAPLKAMPRDSRDLMIAATNSRLLAFDNLSHVPPWLSDALCRLATGGGFATRALYSDDQEKLFDAMRPVLLNGIEELTARPDLLDRAICLTLPQIPESRRRTELDFWREFEAIRRGVLRALLAAVSTSLRNRPTVELPFLPRMADFAVLAVAAETALGLPPGAFLAAYTENRAGANDLAIESSPIGPAVLGLIHRRVVWQGTARELLTELEDHHTDDKTRNRRDWPRQPRALGNALRRLIPNLRMVGIAVTFQRNRTGRLIYLEKTGGTSSLSSRSSHTAPGAVENAVSPLARVPQGDEAVTVATFASSHEIAADAPENGVGDGGDDSDGEMQADSKPPREVLDL